MTQRFYRNSIIPGVTIIALLLMAILATAQDETEVDEALIERGAYLAEIGQCIECHTPPYEEYANLMELDQDQLIKLSMFYADTIATEDELLAGGRPLDLGPMGIIFSSNITPDEATGIGLWTDEELEITIRLGVRPNGDILHPLMAVSTYANWSADDMAAIIGYSEMLEEEAEDFGYGNIVPDLQRIRTAGTHLLSLINDILDLSKIEAGKIEFYLEDFTIEDIIDDIAMTVQPVVEKNNNKFTIETDEELGMMHADVTRIRQIIVNLLSNAAKFTKDGTIILKTQRYDKGGKDWIRIAVSDTGIGMSEAQASKIFSEFTQADVSTTRKYGGTGLGLSISRHFCQLMGGSIRVTSKEGEGSTFTVNLPAKVELPKKLITVKSPPFQKTNPNLIHDKFVCRRS
jgi:two-component sensor histidine kinase